MKDGNSSFLEKKSNFPYKCSFEEKFLFNLQ